MLWEQGDIDEEVILGLILTCVMTRKYLPEFTTQKNAGIDQFFFGGGAGGAFWYKNGYRLCLSGMIFEGTKGVYERIYHFCFK